MTISRSSENSTPPVVILDNARTHSSRFTKAVSAKLQSEFRFLAPYCPEVAPVELAFGALKSKLRYRDGLHNVNIESSEGIEQICNTLASLRSSTWSNAWTKVIEEAKQTIIHFLPSE